MQSRALSIEQIWQPIKWIPDTLRNWLIRQLDTPVDRRTAARKMVANVTANYWEGSEPAAHCVRDISATGAFIYADFQWVPGTIVTMTLRREDQVANSDSPAAVVKARVVRHAQGGSGVQFLYSEKQQRKTLEAFLQSLPEAEPS